MRKIIIREEIRVGFLALLFLLSVVAPAWGRDMGGECYITFSATSTLHDFSGTGKSEPFVVNILKDGGGKKRVGRVVIDVPIRGMCTGKEKRDRKMREMFQSDRFPFIHGETGEIYPDRLREEMKSGGEGTATLSILLTIRDVTREVKAKVSNLREYGNKISFDMEFPLSLKDFHLEAPSTFLGLIKVGDRVRVKIGFYIEGRRGDFFSRIDTGEKGEKDASVAAPY